MELKVIMFELDRILRNGELDLPAETERKIHYLTHAYFSPIGDGLTAEQEEWCIATHQQLRFAVGLKLRMELPDLDQI